MSAADITFAIIMHSHKVCTVWVTLDDNNDDSNDRQSVPTRSHTLCVQCTVYTVHLNRLLTLINITIRLIYMKMNFRVVFAFSFCLSLSFVVSTFHVDMRQWVVAKWAFCNKNIRDARPNSIIFLSVKWIVKTIVQCPQCWGWHGWRLFDCFIKFQFGKQPDEKKNNNVFPLNLWPAEFIQATHWNEQ